MLNSILTAGTAAIRYNILRKEMLEKKYVMFYKGNYNLNIVGFRTLDRTANSFNDYMFCTYFVDNVVFFHIWKITTDPGLYWLLKPISGCLDLYVANLPILSFTQFL